MYRLSTLALGMSITKDSSSEGLGHALSRETSLLEIVWNPLKRRGKSALLWMPEATIRTSKSLGDSGVGGWLGMMQDDAQSHKTLLYTGRQPRKVLGTWNHGKGVSCSFGWARGYTGLLDYRRAIKTNISMAAARQVEEQENYSCIKSTEHYGQKPGEC